MVGVAGRSQGCGTCRKRKIACSKEKPYCSLCTKSGRVCLGYAKQLVFVPVKFQGVPEAESEDSSSSSTDTPSDTSLISRRSAPGSRPTSFWPVWPTTSSESAAINTTMMRSQLVDKYLSQFEARLSVKLGPWMIHLKDRPNPTKAFELSSFALITARLEQKSGTSGHLLGKSSLSLYSRAIQAVQRALADPETAYSDETLAACMLLAQYETHVCPASDRKGYSSHFDGCARLIQLRGPAAHRTGMGQDLYRTFRIMSAMEGLLLKPTFVGQEPWSLQALTGEELRPYDRTIEIMLKAPRLLTGAACISRSPSITQQLEDALDLIAFCWELDGELQSVHSEITANARAAGQVLYWLNPSLTLASYVHENDDRDGEGLIPPVPFPTQFEFVNVNASGTLILYWGTALLVWSIQTWLYELTAQLRAVVSTFPDNELDTVFPPLRNPMLESELPPLRAEQKAFIVLARNINQSVAYSFHDDIGVALLTAPLTIVINVLRSRPEYRVDRCQARHLVKVVKRAGLRGIEFLPPTSGFTPVEGQIQG